MPGKLLKLLKIDNITIIGLNKPKNIILKILLLRKLRGEILKLNTYQILQALIRYEITCTKRTLNLLRQTDKMCKFNKSHRKTYGGKLKNKCLSNS